MSINLEEIMSHQYLLMGLMGWPGGEPTPAGNQEAAKGHLLAAINECSEAMNELNWKPWKVPDKVVDREAFATELMDILQFVATAALVMDLSAIDLESALRDKLKENYRRVKDGEVIGAN